MSTSKDTVAFIEDQLSGMDVRTAPMFGEYAIYCDNKVVGLICDDTLFIKPSNAAAELFDRTTPGAPYPGAKDYHTVPGDALDDRDWLQEAIGATADALPVPRPKKPKARRDKLATGGFSTGGSGV